MRTPTPSSDQGIALVLVLIFTVLIYVLIAELVTTAQMSRMTGENDALAARMKQDQEYRLHEVEESLADDMKAASAQAGGGSSGGMPMPGPGGGEGGGEEDPAASADSSRDPWFYPTPYSDSDLTTYVWVEDENRKFNILTLISADEKFARASRERFVRLVDALREGTDLDVNGGDAEQLASALIEWMRGHGRNDWIPRPPLKSDDKKDRRELTIPLHLDELLFLRNVTPELFFDQFEYDIDTGEPLLLPGLESVLTVYTSLAYDEGDPDKVARQKAQQRTNMPGTGAQPDGNQAGGANPAGGSSGSTGNPGNTGSSSSSSSSGASDEPNQLAGLGIKININTATRPVLRCLLPQNQMPDAVIEAILRYRNEEAPEEEQLEETGGEALSGSGASSLLSNPDGVETGDRPQLQVFATPEDLEKVPEFANIASAEVKQQFLDLITTKSDVFSIHMASLVKRDEENRVFVLRRARSLVMRIEAGEDVLLHPLIRLEAREGVRVFPYDFPKEELEAQRMQRYDMDEFAIEERDWNPFYLEFYRKPEARGR